MYGQKEQPCYGCGIRGTLSNSRQHQTPNTTTPTEITVNCDIELIASMFLDLEKNT
jgi:hypothetical protein